MKIQVFILIALVLLAVLISLGGCVSTQGEPWMFYQAYDATDRSAPAPFFLTMDEAQAYANKMNQEAQKFNDPCKYQVAFIAR